MDSARTARRKYVDFFHTLKGTLKAVGTCLYLTTGTPTTCQCTPTSPKLEPHDVEELNLWRLHCKLTRTAGACRCMSTGRTTSTTKGDRKHASSYTVHTFPAPGPRVCTCQGATATHCGGRCGRRDHRETSPSPAECQAASTNGLSAPLGARNTADHQS